MIYTFLVGVLVMTLTQGIYLVPFGLRRGVSLVFEALSGCKASRRACQPSSARTVRFKFKRDSSLVSKLLTHVIRMKFVKPQAPGATASKPRRDD